MNIFEKANNRLDDFISNNLVSYHKLRNYDYGVKKRKNVSQLSKYISHRILYEYDIIEKLKTIDKKKRFTDEILWRIYWKGYLENHKSIWFEYKNFNRISYNSNLIKAAENGETGIDCFDKWISELKKNNYLHNHSRMWFASIWLFTLELPWQIGANLFMRYLYDGDAASNTLSWRWVAGMHTNKKPYIASNQNINKYTNYRFKESPINLTNKIKIIKNNTHQSNLIPIQNHFSNSKILVLFDNDLYISNRKNLFCSYSKVYILFNEVIEYGLKLSKNVVKFKLNLIRNINKLIPNSEVFNSNDIDNKLKNLEYIDVVYPGVGNNLDLINQFSKKKQININFIYRDEDLFYWCYAKSGFNNFKKSFYKLNKI
ncbi:FAD-binding domain-containing protein [Prochlorococcus marinus]|uniref:FAD-binding domain-containing protein n=1 Tax=Prochlorococcus marinus TaxID=1219 RepID=UPI001C56EB32|nr:FAD-binding domain-containing protein [Prochlorococcus marinus]MBW3042339.1 DNA photolyase [Prochlorococcus marinus str. XMU1408]